ncbi:MAG TPA: hypothetical protein VGB43_06110 [Flavobacterium sp.]
MNLRIKKELLYHILFIICVGVPYINYYELTFVVWTTAILFSIKQRYSLRFIHYLGYFAAILAIAIIVAFFQESLQAYNVIRDFTYLLKPILGLLVGYQLCKDFVINPLRMAVIAALCIAIVHLSIVAFSITFLQVRNINDLRSYGGYFSDFEIYGVILLMFHNRFRLGFTNKQAKWLLIIIGFSSLLYLARTNFIQFAILWLAMKGYFVLNRRAIIVMVSGIVFVLAAYGAIYSSNPQRGAKGLEAFFYKVKIAPFEPFKTRVDKDDWVDFNDNYRSYENILTIRQVSANGWSAVVFGEGLGSTIDLKREVWLQTSFMRYIPFLHNGFMTVFLKSGLLGVCIYLGTIFFFFRQPDSIIPLVTQINLLLLGTGFFLFISNWVFLGFYNLFDTKTILMGLLLAYKERLNKSATT